MEPDQPSDEFFVDPNWADEFRFEVIDGKITVTLADGSSLPEGLYEDLLPHCLSGKALVDSELTLDQMKLARYVFKRAGRFIVATYEQWEAGFLREEDTLGELFFWTKLAGFIEGLQLTDGDKKRAIALECCTNTMGPELREQVNKYFAESNGDEKCRTAFREWDESQGDT